MNEQPVVLITGASSGLGAAAAQLFNDAGFLVYGTSRKSGGIDSFHIRPVVLDVTNETSCQQAIQFIIDEAGRIDVLINNAGMGVSGAVEMTSESNSVEQIDTNFMGCVRMSRAALPYLRQTGGRIIHVGSAAASAPIPFQSLYSASKAALRTFSLALDTECRSLGVRSICIEFGDMRTGFTTARKKSQQSSDNDPYAQRCQKSVARMEKDEQSGMDPKVCAKALLQAAQQRNPKPVRVCGLSYQAITVLIKLIPLRFSQAILRQMYG